MLTKDYGGDMETIGVLTHKWKMALTLMSLYKQAYMDRGYSESHAVGLASKKTAQWIQAQDLDTTKVGN